MTRFNFRAAGYLLLLLTTPWAVIPAVATAADVALLLSADTEGHLGPCDNCSEGVGLGGLSRRASLRDREAGANPVLLIDAGNALFGPDTLVTGGDNLRVGYATMGYAAINLSYRDFRLGKSATLALLSKPGVDFISANIADAASRQLLAKPFVVKSAGGRKIAILGATEVPALDVLPHLAEQLSGVVVIDPAEALRAWLPQARAQSDAVVLVYYGSPTGAAELLREFGKEVVVVLFGGTRPGLLPTRPPVPIAATHEHGKQLARVRITFDPRNIDIDQLPVKPDLAVNTQVEAALAKQAVPEPAVVRPQPTPATLPPSPQFDQIYPVMRSRRNRGVSLGVLNASLTRGYGAGGPKPESQQLVLATEWENTIPWAMVDERKVPTEYQIPRLGDHLYVLVDGSRALRVTPADVTPPGHVPVKNFKLRKIGDRFVGNVMFALPAGLTEFNSLELRFYDFAHGHISLPLGGSDEVFAAQRQAKPIQPASKNEVLEAGVFGLEKKSEVNGSKAPAGMTYVVIDLRARSMFTLDADATAFDPKARPGSKMKIGTVADWTEAHKYLQLVADGEYGYTPMPEGTTLGKEPRFLPDVMTGGQVVFLAPAETQSLEIRCDFPNARTPGGQVVRPKGLTLMVEGTRPQPPKRDPIVSIDDDIFKVMVVAQQAATDFAGAKPADGKKFVVLDVSIRNAGKDGEFFQTKEQLKYVTAAAEQLTVDAATWEGTHRPSELLWVPPGERRTFQVAFQVPANETKPQLGYAGVSKAEVIALEPLDAAAAPAQARAEAPKPRAPKPEVGKPDAAHAEATKPTPPLADAAKRAPTPAEPTQVAVAAPAPPAPPKLEPAKEPDAREVAKTARVAAKQPHKPKGLPGVGLTPEQVNHAIDRGADALWKYVWDNNLAKGYEFGDQREHVLAALALVHSGAHKRIPKFDAALQQFLAKHDARRTNNTYQNGLFCMLVESYGDPRYLPKLREAAQWLLEGQGPNGTWSYGTDVPKHLFAEKRPLRALQVAGGRPLDQPPGGEPLKRMTPWEQGADGDNSVTQYALLGLHSASRSGVPLPPETWTRTLAEHRARQDRKDGSWAYNSPGAGYGSMTCAGICAIALARHELGEADPAADDGIEHGLAWLARNFTLSMHPPSYRDTHLYYYIYSIERVGRILNTEFIGEHEWYPIGARYLINEQRSDGTWLNRGDHHDPPIPSSFALLFLTRATASLDAPRRSGPGTLKTATALQPRMRIHVILDCSGSMLEEMEGRAKFDIAREAVMSLVDALPEQAQFGLRVYGHRKRATEPGASDDTQLLVPIGGIKREILQTKLKELRARGKTPMAKSLSDAKGDVRGATAQNPILVVLLTDGGEDSQPRRDPVKAAEEFGAIEGVRLHVVGFDINRPDWLEQLQAMAGRARGQYLPAEQSAALQRELKSAVFGTPEKFTILDAQGTPVAMGGFGESKTLPEGQYTFRTIFAGKQFDQPFWINPGTTTAVTFDSAMVVHDPGAAQEASPTPEPTAVPRAAPGAAKKFCTSCGTKLAGRTKFCTACGAKL